ncbi:MAG: response regulator [Candidatus Melainabacteria bacterium]
MMTEPVRLLIAEDYEIGRMGLCQALETFSASGDGPPIQVVGEAENGHQALVLVESLQPDVVLMDIEMPEMDGIQATRLMKARWPQIRVIMLTSHKDEREVRTALASGADGYCLKDIRAGRLVQVIHLVAEGGLWLDPVIAATLMTSLQNTPGSAPAVTSAAGNNPQGAPTLTPRETQVLSLIVDGRSNQEIADLLNVSIHTAKTHIANLINKLAVDDRTQAAVKALREGLIAPGTL